MAGTLPVLDTADWRVSVPVPGGLQLAGSHLTADLALQTGGLVIRLTSEGAGRVADLGLVDGARSGIWWTADPAGLTTALLLIARGVDRRIRYVAPPLQTVVLDLLRTVDGSPAIEGIPRSFFPVYAGAGSPLVAEAGGLSGVLAPTPRPTTAAPLLPGPQGRAGSVINTYPIAITADGQTLLPYPAQSPPVLLSTVHAIVQGVEYFPPDIALVEGGVRWTNPDFLLETGDRVALRYT